MFNTKQARAVYEHMLAIAEEYKNRDFNITFDTKLEKVYAYRSQIEAYQVMVERAYTTGIEIDLLYAESAARIISDYEKK